MVLYERELLVYSKTKSITKVYAVKRGTEEKPVWELEFSIKGLDERALLVTALNKPRKFPRLNNLVEMLNRWCPNIENITLDLHLESRINEQKKG